MTRYVFYYFRHKKGFPMKIVNSHQHFWKIDRGDYGWMSNEVYAIRRDTLPADLAPLIETADVAATVVVQAAATVAETEFLLKLAQLGQGQPF